jgi:hypothetical protein
MSVLPPANLAALQLLQQSNLSSFSAAGRERDPVHAGIPAIAASPAQPQQPDPMFSANSIDVNQLKVHFMEQVGKGLGLDVDDFESASAFGQAIKEEVLKITRSPGGEIVLRKIAEDTGLDKLGISLMDFADALIDPNGSAAERLDDALREYATAEAGDSLVDGPVRFDEIGIYSFI